MAGLLGLRTSSGYVAAKHAVIGLTKTGRALGTHEENVRHKKYIVPRLHRHPA